MTGWTFRLGKEEFHPPTVALALLIGAAGGLIAQALGLPLPMLLGSLVLTSAAAILRVRPTGRVIGLPFAFRATFMPVIGVSIGAAFTPDILSDLARWWPSFAALLIFVPVAHFVTYRITRATSTLDHATTYYGTMPGGFIEALSMGDQAGADGAFLVMLQFLRLIFCIVLIPIGFSILTGHVVGSASGIVIGGDHVLSASDWGVLFLCGLIGAFGAHRLGLPAYAVTGPLALSGIAHLAGWVGGGPPGWLISFTQLVIGTSLGARFADRPPRILLTGLRLAAVNVSTVFLLTGLFSLALPAIVGESWQAVFLAYAPGGLVEMSLIALSLEISVIYVTLHHVFRIVLAVIFARALAPRFAG